MADYSGGSPEADHLCVLVHGLWGNPVHMASVAKSLRAKHPRDRLHILVAERNSGSFTYDGIELGGERVCLEIEEELQVIESRGGRITKLSVVGYSLGGLVARYAVGLLYAKGILDTVECMNFTAFASPFLGVRSPRRGWSNHLWNVLGARTLCVSGRQLFGIDSFRDTGRPLLAVLADPHSIFMSGLAKFRRRTLYCNITNDRTAVYYTTGIAKTDPFTDPSKVAVRYVPGYEPVILDPVNPVAPGPPPGPRTRPTLRAAAHTFAGRVPFALALAVFVPIGIVAFLVNSAVQTVRSSRRVQRHEKGLAGIQIESYRVPLWITGLRGAVEDAYENLNSSQDPEYLGFSEDDDITTTTTPTGEPSNGSSSKTALMNGNGNGSAAAAVLDDGAEVEAEHEMAAADTEILALERRQSHPAQPTLALAPYQFAAIQALDKLGWRKYRVWIHEDRHSHAAIIVRMEKPTFGEGRLVLQHWLKEEFLI